MPEGEQAFLNELAALAEGEIPGVREAWESDEQEFDPNDVAPLRAAALAMVVDEIRQYANDLRGQRIKDEEREG